MQRVIETQHNIVKDLLFKYLKGEEGLSFLYCYHLLLSNKNANLDIASMIGSSLNIKINTAQGIRYIQGIITDFGYETPDEDEQGYHLYSCTIRPNMWYLSQNRDSRVFVDQNVLEIANKILEEFGITYENRCTNNYRNYGQSTQYQESSLNYLNRLFEQEGIYYYFEYAENKNTLILCDQNSQHETIMGQSVLPYHANVFAGTPHQVYIDKWKQKQFLTTTQIHLSDYNYQTAKIDLSTTSNTHDYNSSKTEVYNPYSQFKTIDEATHYQQINIEQYKAQTQEVQAEGNVLTLCAGYRFTLERHPHQSANTEYLITTVCYELQEAGYTTGKEQSYYRVNFRALPINHQYRPAQKTLKPQILGTQAAIITGPAGEEVYTNEYGDVKIQFHWDRYGEKNEKSSAWIRVAQGSAGVGFGSVNIPRIGEEVLVDFINGDSDRPIVIGRLYNSANTPPWGYPAAAKQSGIKSKSFNSPLENFNELMFDDSAGNERVNFQAQKDLTSLIKNDETRTINNSRTTNIKVDETVSVGGNRTEDVTGNETISIKGNRSETVTGNESINITGDRTESVTGSETITISQTRTETVTGTETITTGSRTRTVVKGSETINIGADQTVSITATKTENSKNKTENVGATRTINAVTQQHNITDDTHNITRNYVLSAGTSISQSTTTFSITADTLNIQVGAASLVMTSSGAIFLNGKIIEVGGESNVHIAAPDVNIN